jgi:hypothetical protein
MKNRKQLLADFYLDLLAIPNPSSDIQHLMNAVCFVLSNELESDMDVVRNIFERMSSEDKCHN